MNTGSKGSSRHGIGLDGCSGEELADVCTDVCVEADGDGEADVCADGYSQVGQVGQVGQRRKQQFIVFFLKTLRSATLNGKEHQFEPHAQHTLCTAYKQLLPPRWQ